MVDKAAKPCSGAKAPAPFPLGEAPLDFIRRQLKQGATIRAVDTTGTILELQEDGSWYGGLAVSYDDEEPT